MTTRITRLFDILDHVSSTWPGKEIISGKQHNQWIGYDSSRYAQLADAIADSAISKGLRKGDTFATLIRTNLPEWNIVDMGLMQAGMIHVPLHPGISLSNAKYILSQTGVKVLIVQDRTEWDKVREMIKEIPTIQYILSFQRVRGVSHWLSWVRKGENTGSVPSPELTLIRDNIRPGDTATIVYTSGTTGMPRGVVLSHANIVSNVLAAAELQPLGPGHTVLSFLPLSHIYERTSNYLFQLKGVRICYAESYLHVRENLMQIRPHGITVVPRFLEKVESTILAGGRTLKGFPAKIYHRAMQLHLHYRADHNNTLAFRLKQVLFDILVYRTVRKKLGGNIFFIGCGGAPISLLTEKFFWTLGLPVYQGYGLTETSPLITLNRLPKAHVRLGTVGPVIPGIRISLSDEGEILVRGPGVMHHYYKDESYTRQVMGQDGWFHTGDLGRMIDGSFLKITGRKKELFKTSYGKYIAPHSIEIKLRRSPFVANAMVFGEGRKFPGAVIQPDFTHIRLWLEQKGMQYNLSRKRMVKRKTLYRQLEEEVGNVNQTLDKHERIRIFFLVPDLWTVASGDLSASHKLKRTHLMHKYRHLIEKAYETPE